MIRTQSDSFDPLDPDLDVGGWIETGFDWILDTFSPVLDGMKTVLSSGYDFVYSVLSAPPFLVMTAIFAIIALLVRSWQFAIFTVLGFYLIASMGHWERAMQTLALIILAAGIATILAVPLGIWAAKSKAISQLLRPILDFMQTMPAMVYLIPTLFAFSIGQAPGIVSTVIFAMPPGVRFTELAIRQVDKEVVEAGQAFGAAPNRILRQIQLPLALPTIMAGINQVIMLSLSMVVLAALVGAGGLGAEVVGGLSSLNLARGATAGIAVVVLAIFLDRTVAALADRAPVVRASRVRT